jgi:hypothetical protein
VSDVEEYSHAARIGGLRTEVINRFVATQAAVFMLGPPTDKRALSTVLRPMVDTFNSWLRKAGDDEDAYPERELRRRVLLMVTEGRTQQNWANDEAAARVLNLAEEMFNSIG